MVCAAPAKGTSCIATSQKIPRRHVIGFNLGSLITFRFCARVRRREIRGVRAFPRAHSRPGFMPVLDNARRNAKVRKPRLAFTAETRPSWLWSRCRFWLSVFLVGGHTSLATNERRRRDNVRENIRPVTVSLGGRVAAGKSWSWIFSASVGSKRFNGKWDVRFRVKRSSRPPGIRAGDGGLAPKWLRKGRSCRHIRGFFGESGRAPSPG